MSKLSLNVFPYQISPEGARLPVIPISISFGNKKKEIFALVDSRATISIFRADVAEELGIKVESGREVYLGGVGGRIKGYIHKLKIEVSDKNFTCPIVFSYEYLVSLNLLGRESFFRKFKIIFEERKRKITLE